MLDSIRKFFGVPTKAELHKAFATDLNCIMTEPEGPHWKTITEAWWQINANTAQLLRLCQIFIASLRHGATSKNPSTSAPNAQSAISIWRHGLHGGICLRDQLASVLLPEHFLPFEQEIEKRFSELQWRIPFNAAIGLIEKAEKLKTDKARLPRITKAATQLWAAKENGCPVDQLSSSLDRFRALGFSYRELEEAIRH